jgi:hypothetical protein
MSKGGKHHPEHRTPTLDVGRSVTIPVPGVLLCLLPEGRGTMSERVDKFCDGLRDRLNAVEARVQSVKANVQALPGKAEKAVQDTVDEARAKVHAQKERVEKTRAGLKAWAQQKLAETREAIHEWKAKREAKKLTARADRAEAYAADAIALALASIDEAEEAVLDAVAARMDADAAK